MSKQNIFRSIEEKTLRIARQCNSLELFMLITFTIKMLNKLVDLMMIKLREESRMVKSGGGRK